MFSKTIATLALALLSSKVSAQPIFFDIVSFDGDLKFFPSQANSPTSVNSPDGTTTEPEIAGNRFIQNGKVLDGGLVQIANGSITEIPWTAGQFSYTSLCTAQDGVNSSPPVITQNRCEYNLCIQGGCIFLVSGGPFDFDPFVQSASAVPDIELVVIGGDGDFKNAEGRGLLQTLIIPSLDTFGRTLLELRLFGVDIEFA